MASTVALPGPCGLCGCTQGERRDGRLRCAACHWRVGDLPDADLPRPRVEIVYYLRYADRVKIGTSAQPRKRLGALRYDQLLAFEQGGRGLEQQRHRQFAHAREGGEWFRAAPDLLHHITELDCVDPWRSYARWTSEALQRVT